MGNVTVIPEGEVPLHGELHQPDAYLLGPCRQVPGEADHPRGEPAPEPVVHGAPEVHGPTDPRTAAPGTTADDDQPPVPARASGEWSNDHHAISTDLGSTYAFDPALMTKATRDLGSEDFEDLCAAMTRSARKEWDGYVRGLPGAQSHQAVNALATVGVNINGNRLRSTDPVTRFAIIGGVLAFDDGEVVTTQTQTGVLHLKDRNGDPVKFTASRTVTLYLAKKGNGWRIDR
ncbi:MAG: hypothetical protein ACRCSN_20020 [Dermatophilaceae bacterium]